jgi:sulfur transfer complex TusBCD TusB component (DsrH family)
MSVLFVVSRIQNTQTIYKMAEMIAQAGMKVMFLFTEEGCHHTTNRELITSLSYADGLFCLKSDSQDLRVKIEGDVKLIDYVGWIELIEACDKIVSWA